MLPVHKNRIKESLAFFLYRSGISEYLLKRRAANRCIVLMYHRVIPDNIRSLSLSHGSITLGVTAFKEQMKYVANHFMVLPIDEVCRHLCTGKAFPPKSVLVTFDDGWKDNYTHAMPVLKENKISALIFLSTGFIGNKKSFWQERMAHLMWQAAEHSKSNPNMIDALKSVFEGAQISPLMETQGMNRRSLIWNLIQKVKSLEYTRIDEIIHQLESIIPVAAGAEADCKSGDGEFLSWEEVRQMHRDGIDFGSHGVNHLILDKKGVDVDYELAQSKIDIEARLGRPTLAFSYPNGNCNPMIAEKVKSQGYDLAFGTEFGYNSTSSNRFVLKRINVPQNAGENIPLFLGRILGLW